jgi:hypothetical protein
VPVRPNRIGSKIIQNISNAVATGFWKNSYCTCSQEGEEETDLYAQWLLSVPHLKALKYVQLQNTAYLYLYTYIYIYKYVPCSSQGKL